MQLFCASVVAVPKSAPDSTCPLWEEVRLTEVVVALSSCYFSLSSSLTLLSLSLEISGFDAFSGAVSTPHDADNLSTSGS